MKVQPFQIEVGREFKVTTPSDEVCYVHKWIWTELKMIIDVLTLFLVVNFGCSLHVHCLHILQSNLNFYYRNINHYFK